MAQSSPESPPQPRQEPQDTVRVPSKEPQSILAQSSSSPREQHTSDAPHPGKSPRAGEKQFGGLAARRGKGGLGHLTTTREHRTSEVEALKPAIPVNKTPEPNPEPIVPQASTTAAQPIPTKSGVAGAFEPLSPLRRARPEWTGNKKPLVMVDAKSSKVSSADLDCPASPKTAKRKQNAWKVSVKGQGQTIAKEPLSPLRRARPQWDGNKVPLSLQDAKSTKVVDMEDCPASPKTSKRRANKDWKAAKTGVTSPQSAKPAAERNSGGRASRERDAIGMAKYLSSLGDPLTEQEISLAPMTQQELDRLSIASPVHVEAN